MSSDTTTRRAAPRPQARADEPARAPKSRAEELVGRARRRDVNDHSMDQNLSLPETLLDRENFQYRFVADVKSRIKSREAQDWDLVEDTPDNAILPTRHAGVGEGSAETKLRLMRKPKEWFDEDHKRKQDKITATMDATIKHSPAQADGQGLRPEVAYQPKDNVSMTWERGSKPE